MRRLLGCVVGCGLAVLVGARTAVADPFPDRYDRQIETASSQWLPAWHWHWLKAQYYQESLLRPDARSPVGAEGIAQFMPATAKEVWAAMGLGVVDRRVADTSILAGAYYMARLRRIWKSERPEGDRRELAQASYNAGAGSILRAQKRCHNARHWPQIKKCLFFITGKHSRETITYVERIARWRGIML